LFNLKQQAFFFILSTKNGVNKKKSKKEIIKTICDSVNHIRLPKEDLIPDWAHRDNEVTKGDRVEYLSSFLDAFAKSEKGTISFVLSIFVQVSPHGTTPLPTDRFSW